MFFFIAHSIHYFFPFSSYQCFPLLLHSHKEVCSVFLWHFHSPSLGNKQTASKQQIIKQLWHTQKKWAADSLAAYGLRLPGNFPMSAHYSGCVSDRRVQFFFFFFLVEIERLLTRRKPTKATVGPVLHDRPIVENSGLTGLLSNLTHCSGRHLNHWKITGYGL